MPAVGQVLSLKTKNVIGQSSAFKHHFCICVTNRLYLYICKHQYEQDFPITAEECKGLTIEVSYISLSRAIFCPDSDMRSAEPLCTVSDEFMGRFCEHIRLTPVLTERDRAKILNGISSRCPAM